MINENPIVSEKMCRVQHHYRVCWSSIFAGAFVGVGLGFLLHLYGLAISLSAVSSSQHGASVIAIGGVLGMLIGVIASMATAGFVAGYLGRYHYYQIHGGVIYGFVTWSLALLMSAIIAGPLMHYISSYENSLTQATMVDSPTINVTDNSAANNSNLPLLRHNKNTNAPVADVTPKQLAWGGWLVFAMFFVGALASCIGACYGMRCKRHEEIQAT